jgi:hypothetical protein
MKNFAKHFKKLSIILCLIPSIAQAEFRHFDDWSDKEKALFLTYGTVAYIDHRQTRIALDDPCNCYTEVNPLYGRHPHRDKSIAINLAVMGVIYWGVGSLPEDKINPYLLGATLGRTAVVIHNDSVGISWTRAF